MKRKHIVYGIIALSFIVGYNYWLIQRDKQLFDAYVHKTVRNNPPANYTY